METKHYILIGAIVVYIVIVYMFSRLGELREIGTRRLFLLSFFLTPIMGLAFYLNSSHRKINHYTEERYKCDECGYVFSEEHEFCPFCEKEGKEHRLRQVDMFMT